MKPFDQKFGFQAAYEWLARNADGDCCVLVNLQFGAETVTTIYAYAHRVTLFRSLYGPLSTYYPTSTLWQTANYGRNGGVL